jgi:hypothetical protein
MWRIIVLRKLGPILILLVAPFQAHGESASPCSNGSPEERLACLTRAHCPIVVTESDKADCYRRITLDLLGRQAAAPEPSVAVPTPQSANPPAPLTPAAPAAVKISDTTETESETTTAEQISEQNRDASISASADLENFGYEWHEAPREQKIVKEINSRIVFLDTLAHGNYLIGLENGQLWLQVAKSRTRLKVDEKVRIIRGSLRSFKLFPEKSSATNVSRVVCHGEEPSSLCRLFEDWQQAQD